MNPKKIAILTILVVIFMAAFAKAGWLVYHKPEFRGTVIDAETKQPIEGAVVVAVYHKEAVGIGAGSISSIINVRETLTDKNGMFYIPSYTTIIQPLARASTATFIIFKPGYASIEELDISLLFSEDLYKKEVEYPWLYNKDVKFIFASRLIGLPKLKTREENLKATPGHITEAINKTPMLNKLIDQADKALGL